MEPIMPLTRKQSLTIIFSIIFLGCWALIFTQRYPLYIDATNTKNLAPSLFLKNQLSTIDSPLTLTFFTSDNLSKELNLDLLKHWLTSHSPAIEIREFDPIKFPEKADHYDITTDGMIVIEFKNQRQDIDLIEQLIINESHGLENIQNSLTRSIVQLSQSAPPEIMLIHSNKTPLLDNFDPMGLSEMKQIAIDNFINITESHVNDLSKLSQQYDLIIFYKLSESAKERMAVLKRLYSQTQSTVIFNHPKFSDISNQVLSDDQLQFNPGILEDHTNHLLRSETQLILEYTSTRRPRLVGVFPYSSYIDYDSAGGLTPLASTSEDAILRLNEDIIPGPFSIIVQNQLKTRTFVNNYLIATNAWLNQGDNRLIIQDILNAHLDPFPVILERDTSDDFIILTKINLLKIATILIFLPLLVIQLFSFYGHLRRNESTPNP